MTLHKCTLHGKALQPLQRFKADKWVKGPGGTPSNPVRLSPCQASLQEVPWTMRVHTGRQKGAALRSGCLLCTPALDRSLLLKHGVSVGAGTDANVFFCADMHVEVRSFYEVITRSEGTCLKIDQEPRHEEWLRAENRPTTRLKMMPTGIEHLPGDGEALANEPGILRGCLC